MVVVPFCRMDGIRRAPQTPQNSMTCGQPAAGQPPPLTTGLSQPPSKHGLGAKTFQNIEECLVRKNDSGCDTGHLQPAPVGSTERSNLGSIDCGVVGPKRDSSVRQDAVRTFLSPASGDYRRLSPPSCGMPPQGETRACALSRRRRGSRLNSLSRASRFAKAPALVNWTLAFRALLCPRKGLSPPDSHGAR